MHACIYMCIQSVLCMKHVRCLYNTLHYNPFSLFAERVEISFDIFPSGPNKPIIRVSPTSYDLDA